MMNGNEAQTFITNFVGRADPLWTAISLANWNLATTGDGRYKDEKIQLQLAEHRLYEIPADWETVQRLYENRDKYEPELRREVEVLYRYFLTNQSTPAENEALARLEAEIQQIYTTHRGSVGGRSVSDNEISEILRHSTNEAERRQAWLGSKEVGARVADLIRQVGRLRNQIAQRLGFRDHYHFALVRQEIDEKALFDLFGRLAALTDAPFKQVKAEVDGRLAIRLGRDGATLAAWHYADPFFQQSPPVFDANLDAFFTDKDLASLSVQAYRRMGMEVEDILGRSDLYERPGKNQHAFCTRIGRTGDTRILCNLRPNTRWATTQLHELGHAVYNKYLPQSLPYLLRTPAHTNSTEAIAMLMGRLTHDAGWLIEVAGANASAVQATAGEVRRELAANMLIFVRWVLVMLHFEQAFYADPERLDLHSLWWDLVEKYQGVPRPAGRDAPDWAAKYHVALAPVYYHNYVLGELTASQLEHWLNQAAGRPGINPDTGPLLIERFFAHGARYPWDRLVEVATGEPLRPDYFVAQFVTE
ncbi:MAG: M2 family metallopeptidase [Chloroflexota bacterium]